MRRMSKMKKGLVGLTAAAMLAGSCVAGPAFAADETISNSANVSKEVTFTVNITDAWNVTVPTSIEATWDEKNHNFSIAADKLKADIASLPRFQNGKKLAVYLHDKATNGTPTSSLTFTEQNPATGVTPYTYTMELKKADDKAFDGKILEVDPGATASLSQGLKGKVEGVYKSGTYTAKAAFVVKLDSTT